MTQYTYYPASGRGMADYGWLQANYSFSFSNYYNPDMMGFGLLRVLNDDTITGGKGFPPHGHDNMEIITIVQSGVLRHQDSTGASGTITVGDVQVMSAGSGVQHSEYNASDTEPATLFQLWIETKETNITPRYDQKSFGDIQDNSTSLLVSNDGRKGSLMIHQDAFISRTNLKMGQSISYQPYISTNSTYIMLISGEISIHGQVLYPKDAVGATDIDAISFEANKNSDILIIETPIK